MPASVLVIANPASGTGAAEEALAGAARQFRAAGIDAEIVLARSPEALIAAADRAPGQAPHSVVAAGGDGTVSAVASRLVGTGIALGILPLGTMNHFARDLAIPRDIADAVRAIIAGKVATVDVGEVNGRFFLNNSSLGIYPEFVRDREQQQRRLGAGKWTAFLRATLAVLRRNPFLNVHLSVAGRELQRRTPFVFIGNNEYCMEGFSMGERKCLDAGKLHLYVSRRTGRLAMLRLAAMALVARLREATELETYAAQAIRVETHRKRIQVATDGEVSEMETPLLYRIRPGALRVLVPGT